MLEANSPGPRIIRGPRMEIGGASLCYGSRRESGEKEEKGPSEGPIPCRSADLFRALALAPGADQSRSQGADSPGAPIYARPWLSIRRATNSSARAKRQAALNSIDSGPLGALRSRIFRLSYCFPFRKGLKPGSQEPGSGARLAPIDRSASLNPCKSEAKLIDAKREFALLGIALASLQAPSQAAWHGPCFPASIMPSAMHKKVFWGPLLRPCS